MRVSGNVKGISRFWLDRADALFDFRMEKTQIANIELLTAMAEITDACGKEIAVYLNRSGVIMAVEIGDAQTVSLQELTQRYGRGRLSGVRLLHTHPGGNGHLSMMDISAAAQLKMDCVLAVGVGENGTLTNFGLAWGRPDGEMPEAMFFPHMRSLEQIDFMANISEIEKNASKDEAVETSDGITRAILVGITGNSSPELADYSMSELAELAKTAGVVVLDSVLQNKKFPDTATFIGRGKAEELRFLAQIKGADSIIFDDELTPVQMRNLEHIIGRAIIDRSMLILDIFAGRAKSNEGKLQVELAQLKYMMPRLSGQGEVLSRLGGGIGTRGPGETKLEVDRRVIRRRINELEERLRQVEKTRELHRKNRTENSALLVSLVGYTNAGKSTLLNALTDAGVLAENKLFATLDTTIRKVELPDNREMLLSDTVGFIRKLPHHLIAAFRATLEEVVNADLLLHVIDGGAPELDAQIIAVNDVLRSLGADTKPCITVINKIDTLESSDEVDRMVRSFDKAVPVSAKMGLGLPQLLGEIVRALPKNEYRLHILLPYSNAALLKFAHDECRVQTEEYREDGIYLEVLTEERQYNVLMKSGFVIEEA